MDEVFVDAEFSELMIHGMNSIGVCLSDYQMKQFFQYYRMLIETNKVMNLTAITELSDVLLSC